MRVLLLGHPLAHSRSPLMHNAAFSSLGLDHTYVLAGSQTFDVSRMSALLRREDVLGANVTLPYKSDVMSCLDLASVEWARLQRLCNCL